MRRCQFCSTRLFRSRIGINGLWCTKCARKSAKTQVSLLRLTTALSLIMRDRNQINVIKVQIQLGHHHKKSRRGASHWSRPPKKNLSRARLSRKGANNNRLPGNKLNLFSRGPRCMLSSCCCENQPKKSLALSLKVKPNCWVLIFKRSEARFSKLCKSYLSRQNHCLKQFEIISSSPGMARQSRRLIVRIEVQDSQI